MYQISDTELTNRINTFMARKIEKFPELEKKQRRSAKNATAPRDIHNPTFLEKMNDFWVHQVHA